MVSPRYFELESRNGGDLAGHRYGEGPFFPARRCASRPIELIDSLGQRHTHARGRGNRQRAGASSNFPRLRRAEMHCPRRESRGRILFK